ncbi:Bug family tripartite tricarboxylate transporter substrate binding protein [Comamonas composti]|uniref:Bug family tripartite tricarboxylate transporter substrate binding protein n=1 Tax=Comamonas composti TaxID=408558 RepID=UPI00040E676B|nr:tripartite tricarboxylate transporter substrate binding protein [Comamonas composti]
MKKIARLALAAVVSAALMPLSFAAPGAAWPAKQPITLLVPSGAGSSPDTMARVIAEEAGRLLQQTIVVQNRPGASGNLGTNLVAKAAADGYTFGVSFTGPLVNNHVIAKNLPYNPFEDLTPLTLAVHQYNVLVVPASSPIKSLADLVAAAKRPDAKLNYPTTGAGTVSHLAVELLLDRVGGKALHVPYQSSPAAVTSLVSGDTNFAALPPVAVMPMIQDGRLRPIAAVSAKRLSFLPDLPTAAELGYPGVEGSGWIGFIAPVGLPADVQARLHAALVQALKSPQVDQRLKTMYMEAAPQSSKAFAQYMQEELQRWAPLIKRLDLVEK